MIAVDESQKVAKTGAQRNHLVLNILKKDFIIYQISTDEPTWKTPASTRITGRFHRINSFAAVVFVIACMTKLLSDSFLIGSYKDRASSQCL